MAQEYGLEGWMLTSARSFIQVELRAPQQRPPSTPPAIT